MRHFRFAIAFAALTSYTGVTSAQPAATCAQPFCVNRADDDATAPLQGMLRYAIQTANDGAVITFDPALHKRTIELDPRSPVNHFKVSRDLTIAGPGSELLTVSGGNATRLFFIAGGKVQISGLTLTQGLARGGDGGAATGGAGGGGGAAAMGGAIFLNSGSLTLQDVVLSGNRSTGGNGGAGGSGFGVGRGGGGGGFGGSSLRTAEGGSGSDLTGNGSNEGLGGSGGGGDIAAEPGGEAGWGGGGGGGGFSVHSLGGRGALGGPSGFAGGVGGAGGFLDSEEGGMLAAGGGYGGSALGGAIFIRSGELKVSDCAFLNNRAAGGLGGGGAPNGIAKGGALFVCSSSFCGPGHDGIVMVSGKISFQSNSAAQALEDPACSGRDDADVCGLLVVPQAGGDSKH